MSQCKNCGTVFESGTEPWLKQQEHCARHDVVYQPGTECTSCVAERDDEANRTATELGAKNVEVHSSGGDSPPVSGKKGKRGDW